MSNPVVPKAAADRRLGSGTEPDKTVTRVRKEFDLGKTRWGRHAVAALLEEHDFHELNGMETSEILGDVARDLYELAKDLPEYATPGHICPTCIIGASLAALKGRAPRPPSYPYQKPDSGPGIGGSNVRSA